jgi:hypothetical protein
VLTANARAGTPDSGRAVVEHSSSAPGDGEVGPP